ncbi:uncharacterized protein BKCO1_9800018 [Diplodia corticola]|uniref:Uncharacterized protein n=1 Tax=Diplodia corticola TaxID=236234 RepID=A0A1J9QJG4_9PEZI|nr:uncharacterized protein BKCO1_9800018 [Diplodia corticola]OJD29006.1 hypothetical protein BKCO1_9800018 [Diplodia corticola]
MDNGSSADSTCSTGSSMPDRVRSLALASGTPKETDEPYYPSIRPVRTVSSKAKVGEYKNLLKEGRPRVWGGNPWTRCQAHDTDLQRLLVFKFVDAAHGLPTHVLLMPDDQIVKVCAARYDMMMMLFDDLECFDWHDFVSEAKAYLAEMDGSETTFRMLRIELGKRLARLARDTDHFDIWQRDMIRLDHLCQLVIVDCCDPVADPPRPSLVRRLTRRLKQ